MSKEPGIDKNTFFCTKSKLRSYPAHPEQVLICSIPPQPLTLAIVNTMYSAKPGFVSVDEYSYNSAVASVFRLTFNNESNALSAINDNGGNTSRHTIGGTSVTLIQKQLIVN